MRIEVAIQFRVAEHATTRPGGRQDRAGQTGRVADICRIQTHQLGRIGVRLRRTLAPRADRVVATMRIDPR